jgi:DeoR/GlpR family transcriptional regulator of sugar metabolism
MRQPLKEVMMERADAVYVLAHAAKLGAPPFQAWAPLPPDVTVVTDSAATDAPTRPFADRGIEVVTV